MSENKDKLSKDICWERLVHSQVAMAARVSFDEKEMSDDDKQVLNAIIRRIRMDVLEFLEVLKYLDKKYCDAKGTEQSDAPPKDGDILSNLSRLFRKKPPEINADMFVVER